MESGPTEYRVVPSLGKGVMRYALDGDVLHVESAKSGDRLSIPLAEVA